MTSNTSSALSGASAAAISSSDAAYTLYEHVKTTVGILQSNSTEEARRKAIDGIIVELRQTIASTPFDALNTDKFNKLLKDCEDLQKNFPDIQLKITRMLGRLSAFDRIFYPSSNGTPAVGFSTPVASTANSLAINGNARNDTKPEQRNKDAAATPTRASSAASTAITEHTAAALEQNITPKTSIVSGATASNANVNAAKTRPTAAQKTANLNASSVFGLIDENIKIVDSKAQFSAKTKAIANCLEILEKTFDKTDEQSIKLDEILSYCTEINDAMSSGETYKDNLATLRGCIDESRCLFNINAKPAATVKPTAAPVVSKPTVTTGGKPPVADLNKEKDSKSIHDSPPSLTSQPTVTKGGKPPAAQSLEKERNSKSFNDSPPPHDSSDLYDWNRDQPDSPGTGHCASLSGRDSPPILNGVMLADMYNRRHDENHRTATAAGKSSAGKPSVGKPSNPSSSANSSSKTSMSREELNGIYAFIHSGDLQMACTMISSAGYPKGEFENAQLYIPLVNKYISLKKREEALEWAGHISNEVKRRELISEINAKLPKKSEADVKSTSSEPEKPIAKPSAVLSQSTAKSAGRPPLSGMAAMKPESERPRIPQLNIGSSSLLNRRNTGSSSIPTVAVPAVSSAPISDLDKAKATFEDKLNAASRIISTDIANSQNLSALKAMLEREREILKKIQQF